MTSGGANDAATAAEHDPVAVEDPAEALSDADHNGAKGSATGRDATAGSRLFQRSADTLIGAVGSVVAACIVTWGACHVADVFQPSLVRLDNVIFNMRHIVEIVDTPQGCSVIMSNSAGVVADGEQHFSSHSLDLAGCRSLQRAVEQHTVSGVGRVTQGEVFLSGLAQGHFITTTGTCPDEMEMAPFALDLPNGASAWLCRGSVDFALRLAEGPPWPESWKTTGLILFTARGSCLEGMLFHADHDDLWWCCFGLPTIGEPHPGHTAG